MSEHIVPRPEITAEKLRELLDYDPETGTFTWRVRVRNSRIEVGAVAGSRHICGYTQIYLQGRPYLAHRLAWLHYYGTWPKAQIDHINRDRADSRISNLRDVTHKQNQQNLSKSCNNTSGFAGVHWVKRDSRWKAQITYNYRHIHLGYFTEIAAAIAARKAGELKYWGTSHAS